MRLFGQIFVAAFAASTAYAGDQNLELSNHVKLGEAPFTNSLGYENLEETGIPPTLPGAGRSVTGSLALSDRKRPSGPCPDATVARRGKCMLDQDVAISEPLVVEGVLDCRGHRISATQVGTPDYVDTAANEYAPSVPEIGILQFGTSKLTVQNCVLDGFDFGILIVDSKGVRAQTRVFDSKIENGYFGVRVLRSDNILIHHSTINYPESVT